MSTPLDFNPQTVVSREIAELTGETHKQVLRDIDNILKTLKPDLALGFRSTIYLDFDNTSRREFDMDQVSVYLLATTYDIQARMRILKHWQEQCVALPDFSNPILAAEAWTSERKATWEALRALEEATTALEALEEEEEEVAAYIQIGRSLTGTDTPMTRRDWVAFMRNVYGLGAGERQVTTFLIDEGYCYRVALDKSLRAYADHADFFKLEVEVVNGYRRPMLKITGEGVEVLTPLVLEAFDPEYWDF